LNHNNLLNNNNNINNENVIFYFDILLNCIDFIIKNEENNYIKETLIKFLINDILNIIEFDLLFYITKIFIKFTSLKRYSNDLKELIIKLIEDSEYNLKIKLIPIYLNGNTTFYYF
jgi:hypothetical protein